MLAHVPRFNISNAFGQHKPVLLCCKKCHFILQNVNLDGQLLSAWCKAFLIKNESHCHVSGTDARALIVTCLLLMRTQ